MLKKGNFLWRRSFSTTTTQLPMQLWPHDDVQQQYLQSTLCTSQLSRVLFTKPLSIANLPGAALKILDTILSHRYLSHFRAEDGNCLSCVCVSFHMMEWRKAEDDRFMMAGDLEHAKQHIQHSEIFKNNVWIPRVRRRRLTCINGVRQACFGLCLLSWWHHHL